MSIRYAVVKNAVSNEHLCSMRKEIKLLQAKYAGENRNVEEECCELDVFADLSIPDSSPARTRLDAYLSMRSGCFRSLTWSESKEASQRGNIGEGDSGVSARPRTGTEARTKRRRLDPVKPIKTLPPNGDDEGKSADASSASLVRGSASEAYLKVIPRICQKLLKSERVFLFNEQYIVKPSATDVEFAWHRDGEEQLGMWYREDETQYVSAWIALDKMTRDNGTLVVRPFGESKSELSVPPAVRQEDRSQKSVTIECEAGDCVVFSDTLWHCSGTNRSKDERRVAYAQYTSTPLCGPKNAKLPLRFAVPCELDC
mmetsp:Transcript_35881/g.69701  ORF Transcript_35881/g.69701 Transcript_35881/m.69701 type:complete len:314 (-) Transcript_35881:213-1154(-)